MPPSRLQNELKYHWDISSKVEKLELSLSHLWMAAQNRVAFMETPSQDYQVLNLNARLYFEYKGNWILQTGVRNLTNANYIDHLSRLKNIGMPAPGRHFYLSIRYQVQKQH